MHKLLILLATILTSFSVVAGPKLVNLSLTPDIAVFDKGERIEGLTLSIWGQNPQSSLEFGFVNGSTGESKGLALAFLVNYTEDFKGVSWAPVNYATNSFLGWQGGLINYTEGKMTGFQSGLVNYAGRMTGLQLGLVNYAKEADSAVQVGLINVITQNTEWFSDLPDTLAPGMVFVNWRF